MSLACLLQEKCEWRRCNKMIARPPPQDYSWGPRPRIILASYKENLTCLTPPSHTKNIQKCRYWELPYKYVPCTNYLDNIS